MNLLDRTIAGVIPIIPRPVIGRFSRRYIAGDTIDDAVRVIRRLNRQGCAATVDILGENTTRPAAAGEAASAYRGLLDRLHAEDLDANISVKLTQIGLTTDPERCLDHMRRICRLARQHDNFVRIDMEDATVTQATLDIHAVLDAEFSNVGAVIQAYLRRSRADAKALARRRANIRLCKGIYIEPRSIAFRDPEIIRRSFVELLEILLAAGCYVGIATHDEVLVFESLRIIDRLGLDRERYEFQMLLGVEEELRRILVEAGHRLRVYVPFGDHWYAYSMRRLKENPHIAGHLLRNVLRR